MLFNWWMPIKVSSSKLVNRSILINKSGEIVKTYDKMHMFDVVLSSTEQYQESENIYLVKSWLLQICRGEN